MKMAKRSTTIAGIDTSKAKLDIAIAGGSAFVVSNDKNGWAQAAEQLRAADVKLIGIEATGGYERDVARYLQAAGFVVQVMQPLQVKAFAKLHLQRAKNDRIDARLIAACTQVLGSVDKLPTDIRFDALADHLTAIEQWEEDIVRAKVRLEHERDARRRRILDGDIKRLKNDGLSSCSACRPSYASTKTWRNASPW